MRTPRRWPSIAGPIVFLVAIGALGRLLLTGPSPTTTQEIIVDVDAGFLAPYRARSIRQKSLESYGGPIRWLSLTTGVLPVRLWNVTSYVRFSLSPDYTNVTIESIEPVVRGPSVDGWDLWRHRHAYFLIPPDKYIWHAVDEYFPSPFAEETGKFYDRTLRDLWRTEAIRLINYLLAHPETALPFSGGAVINPRYLPERLPAATLLWPKNQNRPVPINFRISVWGVLVRVSFTMRNASAAVSDRDVFQPAPTMGAITWTYDRNEWRERYGYRKSFWGGYVRIDENGSHSMTASEGRAMDDLMNHVTEYWSVMAAHRVHWNIRRQLGTSPAAG